MQAKTFLFLLLFVLFFSFFSNAAITDHDPIIDINSFNDIPNSIVIVDEDIQVMPEKLDKNTNASPSQIENKGSLESASSNSESTFIFSTTTNKSGHYHLLCVGRLNDTSQSMIFRLIKMEFDNLSAKVNNHV